MEKIVFLTNKIKLFMMNPLETYNQWRANLKQPDDSIFYYHPSLERIVLGCAMYQIASRPLLAKLGKAESLTINNIYINDMITAWIDEDGENFDFVFNRLMTLMEAFNLTSFAMQKRYPGKKKVINQLQYTFTFWVAVAGDIGEERANELLDDITTDGHRIESEKISMLVKMIQPTVVRDGFDLDMIRAMSLVEDTSFD